MTLTPGQILDGRYEVVETIQAGGMGALYRGRDNRLAGSPCAIKAMLPQNEQFDEYVRGRFVEEMRVLSGLNHPGIPRVRDHFVEEHTIYIVMDLIEGCNLGQKLHKRMTDTGRPLTGPEAVDIGLQALDVLEYLHGHNPPIVHRDIKPANLIEEPGGRIKLVDFGLATPETNDTRSQVGTLGYCPMEQMRGKVVAQSDIYALGATLHHLLTGKPPMPLTFEPLTRVRADLPVLLIEAINVAIARNPEDRHQDVAAFRAALQKGAASTAKMEVQSPLEATMAYSGVFPGLPPVSAPKSATVPVAPAPPRERIAPLQDFTPPPVPLELPPTPSATPWILSAVALVALTIGGFAMLGGHSSRAVAEESPTPSASPAQAVNHPAPVATSRVTGTTTTPETAAPRPLQTRPPVKQPIVNRPAPPKPVETPAHTQVATQQPKVSVDSSGYPQASPGYPMRPPVAKPAPRTPQVETPPVSAQPSPRPVRMPDRQPNPDFPDLDKAPTAPPQQGGGPHGPPNGGPPGPPPGYPGGPPPGGPPGGPPPNTQRPDPYLQPR